jgi:hypothetical protein
MFDTAAREKMGTKLTYLANVIDVSRLAEVRRALDAHYNPVLETDLPRLSKQITRRDYRSMFPRFSWRSI